MATKNLKDLMRKTTEGAAQAKADQDKKDVPTDNASHVAFVKQVTTVLTKKPVIGALDTLEPVDPSLIQIQANTRMPGATHKAATFKLDNRLLALLDDVSKKQNIAALVSHLLVRGLSEVLREMKTTNNAAYYKSYDCNDRNAFCGVTDADLLALIRHIELTNQH